MKSSNIYKFKKREEFIEKQKNINSYLATIFFLLTCGIFTYAILSMLGIFNTTRQVVDQPFKTAERKIQDDIFYQAEQYAKNNIPYFDPDGRFSIEFFTPAVSDHVVVYIFDRENPDKAKADADSIIESAKRNVKINKVTYIQSE